MMRTFAIFCSRGIIFVGVSQTFLRASAIRSNFGVQAIASAVYLSGASFIGCIGPVAVGIWVSVTNVTLVTW